MKTAGREDAACIRRPRTLSQTVVLTVAPKAAPGHQHGQHREGSWRRDANLSQPTKGDTILD